MRSALIALVLLAGAGMAAAQPPSPAREFTDPSGDFTIRVSEITRTRRFLPNAQDQVSLRMLLYLEAKKAVQGVQWAPLTSAVDDTGASLLPPQATGGGSGTSFPPAGSTGRVSMPWQFTLYDSADRALEIRHLKGIVTVTLSTGTEEFRFDKLDEVQTVEHAPVKVTLRSAKREGPRFSAQVYVEGLPPQNTRPTSMPMVGDIPLMGSLFGQRTQFVVIGADGSERPASSTGLRTDGAGSEYTLQWILPPNFTPQAVVFRMPKGTERKEIPFEFRGVPLP